MQENKTKRTHTKKGYLWCVVSSFFQGSSFMDTLFSNLCLWSCNSQFYHLCPRFCNYKKMRKNHFNSQLCKWKFTIISLQFQYIFFSLADERLLLSDNTWSVLWNILNLKIHFQLKFKKSPSTQCGFPHQNYELHTVSNSSDPPTEHWPSSFLSFLEGTQFSQQKVALFIIDELYSGEI